VTVGRWLTICTGWVWLLSLLVITRNLEDPGLWLQAMACISTLMFAPLALSGLGDRWLAWRSRGRADRRQRGHGLLSTSLQLVPTLSCVMALLWLPIDGIDRLTGVTFGALVGVSSVLLRHAGRSDRSSSILIVLAPITGILGLAVHQSALLLALLIPATLCALSTALLLHARMARRAAPRAYAATPVDRLPLRPHERLRSGALLGLLALLAAALLFVVLDAWRETLQPGSEESAKAALEDSREGDLGAGSETGEGRVVPSASGSIEFSSLSAGAMSDEVVMIARPGAGREHGSSLYLRGSTLDTFTPEGMVLDSSRRTPSFEDADDGVSDGWTHVRPAPPAWRLASYELEFTTLMGAPSRAGTVLFAPAGLVRVRVPELRYSDATQLRISGATLPGDSFELCSDRAQPSPDQARTRRAGHADARYLELPSESTELARIREVTREWTRSARSDWEVVEAIQRRFQEGFEYDIEGTGFHGLDAIVAFLESGSGFCTYYAATTVLMLRLRGIPARVATGFLAREWSEEEDGYVVRRRHGHAWAEAAFEGLGWISVESTPATRGRLGPGAASRILEDLRRSLARWTGDGSASLGEVVRAMLVLPLRAAHSAPWSVLTLLTTLVVLSSLLRRRSRRTAEPAIRNLTPRTREVYQRLLETLGKLGYHRGRGQTFRELGRRAAAAEPACAEVPAAVDLLYRARFGARPLQPSEEAGIDQLAARLSDHSRARQSGEKSP